ncbi:MAG: dTDP-4-dehydrorhamnose reductase [Actinomycetota bacterium]
MKIAVTGAGGGLGRAFLAAAGGEHDVHPFTHAELDVRSASAVERTITSLKPDAVFHLAAMTAVDACEEDPQGAAATNVLGSRNVAEAARAAGALLLSISTDYVFDGEKEKPYHENDVPNPISVYGKTKYEGERAAQEAAADVLIVRTAWVYGAGNDFLSKAVRRLAGGEEVGAIADQIGSPTHVAHLAERLLPLTTGDLRGLVHLAGPEPASWYDVLVRAKALGDLKGEVVAQKAEELNRPAKRPSNSALTSVILTGGAVPPMPPLDEGIERVLRDVGV